MAQVSTLVLAGGRSSRMGQDKALLTVDGVPLLRRISEIALACTSEVKVVTPWPKRYEEIVPAGVSFVQEMMLSQEITQSHGPLVGLAQGLAETHCDWVLALACDLPNLEAAALRTWMGHLEDLPQTTVAYIPRIAEHWEPLCGFYRRSCLEPLQIFIRAGGRSFQRWLDSQAVAVIDSVDPTLLVNLNTPADVASLQRTTA